MPTTDLLQAGIAAARAGDMASASTLLGQFIKENPNSEQGWLWLGRCRTSPQERAYCFNRVLTINPINMEAHKALQDASPAAPTSVAAPAVKPLPRAAGSQLNAATFSATASSTEAASVAPAVKPLPRAAGGQPNAATFSATASSTAATKAVPPGRKFKLNPLWVLGGLVAILVVCLLVEGGWVLVSSRANAMLEITVMPTWAPPTATPTPSPQPSATSSATPAPTATPTPTVPTATLAPTPTLSAKAVATAQSLISQANQLVQAGSYKKAMPLMDRAVTVAPRYGLSYYLRGVIGLAVLQSENADPSIRPEIYRYLADVNQAMVYSQPTGDYYVARYALEEVLGIVEPYRVDQDFWNAQSLPDLEQAIQMGTTFKNSEQDLPLVLAKLGRCQAALDSANQQLKAKPKSTVGLYVDLAFGDLCANDLKNALKNIETAIRLEATPQRQLDRVLILYNAGRYAEARDQFDVALKVKSADTGIYWYAWRALLDAKLDDWDAVKADLTKAGQPIPTSGGVDAYVRGLQAQKAGDQAGALRNFQDAEAKLFRLDGPVLLAELQQQLTQAGGTPLAPTVSVPPTATPKP